MPFQKGKGKTGGRKKGIKNRTTNEAREILDKILYAEIDNISASLNEIRKKNKFLYLEMLSKFLGYSLPKKTDITSGGKEIQSQLPSITIKTKNA